MVSELTILFGLIHLTWGLDDLYMLAVQAGSESRSSVRFNVPRAIETKPSCNGLERTFDAIRSHDRIKQYKHNE
jgi:hypothetical protein